MGVEDGDEEYHAYSSVAIRQQKGRSKFKIRPPVADDGDDDADDDANRSSAIAPLPPLPRPPSLLSPSASPPRSGGNNNSNNNNNNKAQSPLRRYIAKLSQGPSSPSSPSPPPPLSVASDTSSSTHTSNEAEMRLIASLAYAGASPPTKNRRVHSVQQHQQLQLQRQRQRQQQRQQQEAWNHSSSPPETPKSQGNLSNASSRSSHSGSSDASSADSNSSDDDVVVGKRYARYRKYLNPDQVGEGGGGHEDRQVNGARRRTATAARTAARTTATGTVVVTTASQTVTVGKAWQRHSDQKPKLGAAPVLDYSHRYKEAVAEAAAAEQQQQQQQQRSQPGSSNEAKKSKKRLPKLQSDKLSADDLKTLGRMLFGLDGDNTDDDNTTLGDQTTTHTRDSTLGDRTTTHTRDSTLGDRTTTHTRDLSRAGASAGAGEDGGWGERGGPGGDDGRISGDGNGGGPHRFQDAAGTDEDGKALAPMRMAMYGAAEQRSQPRARGDAAQNSDGPAEPAPTPRTPAGSMPSLALHLEVTEEEIEEVAMGGEIQDEDYDDDSNGGLQYEGHEIPMDDDSRLSSGTGGEKYIQTSVSTSLGSSTEEEVIEEWIFDGENEHCQQEPSRSMNPAGTILATGVHLAAADRDDEENQFEDEGAEVSEDYEDEGPEGRRPILSQASSTGTEQATGDRREKGTHFPVYRAKKNDVVEADGGSEGFAGVFVTNNRNGTGATEEPSETDGDDFSALWEKSVKDEQKDLHESYQSNSKRKPSSGLDSLQSLPSKQSSIDTSSRLAEDSLCSVSTGDDAMEGSKRFDSSLSFGRSWECQGNDGQAFLPSTKQRMDNSADELEASILLQELGASKTQKDPFGNTVNSEDEDQSLNSLPEALSRKGPSAEVHEESDEFSLEAAHEFTKTELHSIVESPEYDFNDSKMLLSGNEAMKSMNQGLSDLDTSFSANNDIELALEAPQDMRREESLGDIEGKESPNGIVVKKPAYSSGVWRHVVRGSVALFLLSAIGIPLYFLVWYNSGNEGSSDNPQNVDPIFPPSPATGTQSPSRPSSMYPSPDVQSPSLPPAPSVGVEPTPSVPPADLPTSLPATSVPQPPSVLPPTVPPRSSPSPTTFDTIGGGPADNLRDFLISSWPSLDEDLVGSSTPQFFAYDWLLNNTSLSEFSEERILQRFALATFYFSTDGANWRRSDRWLSSEHECLWYTSSGTLPCDDDLQYTSLDLALNDLVGTIPSELALLSNGLLHVDLTSNDDSVASLTGSIPSELGLLTLLESINLSGNQLQDSLPSEIGDWRSVRNIDFNGNQFSGSLPATIANWTELNLLNLENNELEGTLPTTIGVWTRLLGLYLGENSFVGPIPEEIGNLDLLSNLELQGNRFTLLPSEIGKLQLLRDFSASQNEFAGPLVTEIGNLGNLLSLDLSRNSFTGSLPSGLGNLIVIRDNLDLSQNSFSGSLPSGLGRLIFLRKLQLQSNDLSGTIPATFANLDRLNVLRLEDNPLTGTVPDVVCTVFEDTLPIFVTDCLPPNGMTCECCMFCCEDGDGCECQFSNTELEFLCADFSE